MNVQVISEKIMKPCSPTPNHLRYLRASMLDQVNAPVLMPLIFFYNSQKSTTNINTTHILDRLDASLPVTLSIFYPLGGRVLNANYIECNDEGVPYIHTTVDKPLKDLVLKADATLLDKLLPSYGQEGYTSLLLAIQVNVFSCGGLAIGVKMSHAIADGFSMLMFVKTWASIARDGQLVGASGKNSGYQNLTRPYFDIWKIFLPSTREEIIEEKDDDVSKVRPVTKLFLFSEIKLLALRSKLFSCDSEKKKSSLAMVLSAFIWSRIKVACHQSCNIRENVQHEVFHAVNLRPKVALPTERSYYFGNVLVNAIAKSSMKLNDENETLWMRDILGKMNESIQKVNNDKFIRDMQQNKEDLRFITNQFIRHSKGEVILLGFSNVTTLPVYEADFGWGKPVWVTMATLIFKDLVILIPASPSSKDIVAFISLGEDDMAKLEKDVKFKAFLCKAFLGDSKL